PAAVGPGDARNLRGTLVARAGAHRPRVPRAARHRGAARVGVARHAAPARTADAARAGRVRAARGLRRPLRAGGRGAGRQPAGRQLLRRARERVAATGRRFPPDQADHERLFERFLRAFTTGDVDGLRDLLAADAVAYTDGGGKVRAALRPVTGAEAVARFAA